MKKSSVIIMLLALLMLAASCAPAAQAPAAPVAPDAPDSPSIESPTAPTEPPSAPVAPTDGGSATSDGAFPAGDWVIALSNSFYGNTWRKQMVDLFEEAAQNAKDAGYIKDYVVQNGDGTVNAQIAQINSFILQGVDAICIIAQSPTALHSVIQQALDAGIVVVAFDSLVDNDGVYKMASNWDELGTVCTSYVMDRIGGKGNVIVIRGVSGTSSDAELYAAQMKILDQYPEVNVLAEVIGEYSNTLIQEGLLNILPSLPEIDAVITHCGGDTGIINAFQQTGRELPVMTCATSAEIIKWWIDAKAEFGYESMGECTSPACAAQSLWIALNVLNGVDVPYHMWLPFVYIQQDEVDNFADMQPGTMVAIYPTPQFVYDEIIVPAR